MSEPLVIRFQRMALDNETATTDLLRMAKAIAVKLQLIEITEWIDYELNGYPATVAVPDYRITKGKLLGHNPQIGYIPMMVGNAKQEDNLRTVHIDAPVTELALAHDKPNAIMDFPFSTEYSKELQNHQPDFLRFPIVRRIGQSKMLNVVEQVRNRLLNWSLALEQQGILGENLQFSQQDKDKASMTTNNFNFNGNLNNAGVIGAENHGFSQQNTQQVLAGDFGTLQKQMEALGVQLDDIQELKVALVSDPKPIVPGKFGPNVSSWLGKIGVKAAEGLLNRSLDQAAPIIFAGISKYLGF